MRFVILLTILLSSVVVQAKEVITVDRDVCFAIKSNNFRNPSTVWFESSTFTLNSNNQYVGNGTCSLTKSTGTFDVYEKEELENLVKIEKEKDKNKELDLQNLILKSKLL